MFDKSKGGIPMQKSVPPMPKCLSDKNAHLKDMEFDNLFKRFEVKCLECAAYQAMVEGGVSTKYLRQARMETLDFARILNSIIQPPHLNTSKEREG